MAADDESTYAIVLQDETSGPAQNAAAALEQLKAKLEQDTRALRDMQAAMSRLKGSTSVDVEAFRKLRDQIAAQKAVVAQTQAEYVKLGGTFGKVEHGAENTGRALDRLLGATKRLPGPIGGLAGGLDDLVKLVAGGGPLAAGLIAIAAAAVLAVAGLGVAGAGLLQFALAQSNARRAELSQLDALASVTQSNEKAARSAATMQGAVDRVTDSYALSRAEVVGLAQHLARAGVSTARFEERLNHAANVAVRRKWGGDLDDAMLDLGVQAEKAHERIGRIFSGLKIEGFLRGLNEVTSLLSQNTATGRALKEIVETIFQPLADALGDLGPVARRFFQGLVIGALELLLAVDDLRFLWRRTFGSAEILGGIDAQTAALNAGIAVMGTLAAGAVVLGVALVAVAAGAAAVAAPVLAAVAALGALVYGAVQAYEWVSGLQGVFRQAGNDAVAGLVRGLREGRDAVVGEVRALADGARDALEGALEIHSPSRVFAELGEQIPAGLADGVRSGAGEVDAAVAGVVSAPSVAAGAGPSGARTVTIGELHVHTAATDAAGMVQDLRPALEDLLEGLAVEAGREPSP